jgi:hypothetical protein
MRPIRTEDTTTIFGGKGFQELPARKLNVETEDPYNNTAIETVWELDEVDKKLIAESGVVYVTILGDNVLPFKVTAFKHKEDNDGADD